MTKFLISVRNPEEARLLASYPIGVVDLKDPGKGGLGRLEEHEIPLILSQLNASVPKSIAFGELLNAEPRFTPEFFKSWEGLKEFAFVKFGLAGLANVNKRLDWKSDWLNYRDAISTLSSLVAVFYSDWITCDAPRAEDVIDLASSGINQSQQPHLLIDTFDKSQGTSIELLGWKGIESLIQKCKDLRIKSVVAGSISLKDINQLISLEPDFVGLRGAVCCNGREKLDEAKLAVLFSKRTSSTKP